MTPVALIAVNFLREHRWPVLLLFAWITFMALLTANFGRGRIVPGDVLGYIVSQAIFICVFSAFLAADAIHNDRKSKRILLVLSKSLTRFEYLLAPILGTGVVVVAYALLFGACCRWLRDRAALPTAGLWELVLLVIVGSLLSASVALFFSTFLNPYVAIAATGLLFAAPGMFHAQQHHWLIWLPGLPILQQIVNFGLTPEWMLNWKSVVIAILESGVFWAMAALVFNRKDIAIPVE
jgi:ABC-type transport system involved in multi-copper enzyme maturation permease subunit